MQAEYTIQRILEEMEEQNLFPKIYKNIVKRYLYMSYAVGFDEGSRSRSNAKLVEQLNPVTGEVLRIFPSAAAAARSVGTHKANISHCCVGRYHIIKGYMWRYVEPKKKA